MAGIYRKFEITGVTANQARTFADLIDGVDLRGMTGSSIGYDPSTSTLAFDVHIDTEDLPDGVTAADLRTRVRNYIQNRLGKFPDIDVAVTDGSTGLTGRDRARQFIQALADGIDPRDIGVEAPVDTKEARIEVLRKYAAASKAHWGL